MEQKNIKAPFRKSVLDFQSVGAFLADWLSWTRSQGVPVSYGMLQRRLSLGSRSLMAMLSLGYRLPSADVLIRLRQYFDWNDAEFAHAISVTTKKYRVIPLKYRDLMHQYEFALPNSPEEGSSANSPPRPGSIS